MEKTFGSDGLPLDFQRGWVQDDDHIWSLLAPVSRSYPIGAELLLPNGQQRLTSLFRTLGFHAPIHEGPPRQRGSCGTIWLPDTTK